MSTENIEPQTIETPKETATAPAVDNKHNELLAKLAEYEKKEAERIESEKKKQQAEAEKKGEFEKLFSQTKAEKEKIENDLKQLSEKVKAFEAEKEERRLNLLNKLDKDDQEVFKNLDEKQLQKLIEKQSPKGSNGLQQPFKLDQNGGNSDKDEIQNMVVKASRSNNPMDALNLRNSLLNKFS